MIKEKKMQLKDFLKKEFKQEYKLLCGYCTFKIERYERQ